MTLKIYNTLTRKIEKFVPMHKNRVYMFVCGPTVYDHTHVGHGRTYSFYDTVARYLRYLGYTVFYLQNITDIDDKIIKRAQEKGVEWYEIARKYEKEYYEVMKKLNITSVNFYARATEHIDEIISQIKRLIDKGYGYILDDGVYYDVSKFSEYGKLSKQKLEGLKPGARVHVKKEKRTPYDFVLWKAWKEGEPYWESPWGKGRPGWHIEDTAITEKYFGPQYDIHGGGEDLIFPHHECEIAQMEAISGKKPMVRYWMHTAFLTINKEKMSKSKGNIITLKEAIKKWGGEALRVFYAQAYYRQPQDFAEEYVNAAKETLMKMYDALMLARKLEKSSGDGEEDEKVLNDFKNTANKYFDAMDNDFNTPVALAALHEYRKKIVEYSTNDRIGGETWRKIREMYAMMGNILGIFFEQEIAGKNVEKYIELLISIRAELRKRKIYDLADKIRDELAQLGIQIVDTKNGSYWSYK